VFVLSSFVLLAAFSIVSFRPVTPGPQQRKFKNLKVLPANIPYDSLDHVMDQFKADLGVKCSYCHAPSKDNSRKMDMASDANPKKDICRDMMRMTGEMNQKYFRHPACGYGYCTTGNLQYLSPGTA
jgi:aerobic-type carbon monoxide dehydrogenase small subunit (CoxS/CutS family)